MVITSGKPLNQGLQYCWSCSLGFSTLEKMIKHRRNPRSKASHDRKFREWDFKYGPSNVCECCCLGIIDSCDRDNHEQNDPIHWINKINQCQYNGRGEVACTRCYGRVSVSNWSIHELTSMRHNVCHVCGLDFPLVDELERHIKKVKRDGRHEFVCQQGDCLTVCQTEEDLEDHSYELAKHQGYLYEHAKFQCEHCRKILGTLQLWQEHTKTFHLDVVKGYELPDENGSDK